MLNISENVFIRTCTSHSSDFLMCCVGFASHDHNYSKLLRISVADDAYTVLADMSSIGEAGSISVDQCSSAPHTVPIESDKLKMAHNKIRRLQREVICNMVIFGTVLQNYSGVISSSTLKHFRISKLCGILPLIATFADRLRHHRHD